MRPEPDKITACIIDTGIFAEMAATLSRSFAKTYYCCALKDELETPKREAVGAGLGNLTVISSMWDPDVFNEVGLFIFLDIGYAPEQLILESMGKRVWGPRMGDELELDRVLAKKLLQKLGCAVGEYDVVAGFPALVKFLDTHPGWFVKVSRYRGLMETFKVAANAAGMKTRLNILEEKLEKAGVTDTFPFCCEAPIDDCVEYGSDMYTVDGEYPDSMMGGLEIKDAGYIGQFKPYTQFPKEIIAVEHKLSETFEKYRYRGFLSYDARIPKGGPVYLTDFCCRCAAPPNHVYQVLYKNLAEIVSAGADGEMVNPDCDFKWGTEALIETRQGTGRVRVDFPEEFEDYVKLRYAMQDADGRRWSVPMISEENRIVGSVVGVGNTLDEARDMACEIAESVTGDTLSTNCGALDEAEAEAEKANKMGIRIFT